MASGTGDGSLGKPEARLQLALDVPSLSASAHLASVLRSRLARVEVGTPLLLHSGSAAVEIVRSVVREGITVVADTKICDAGGRIARDAFGAGATIVTVTGVAVDGPTWRGVLEAALAAPQAPGTVMIDTIGWPILEAGKSLQSLVQVARAASVPVEVCVHRPKLQPPPFSVLFDELVSAGAPADVRYLVAGQMGAGLVSPALTAGFEIVVVGSAVSDVGDPCQAWESLLEEAAT